MLNFHLPKKNWADLKKPNQSQRNVLSNHHGHPVLLDNMEGISHWIVGKSKNWAKYIMSVWDILCEKSIIRMAPIFPFYIQHPKTQFPSESGTEFNRNFENKGIGFQ